MRTPISHRLLSAAIALSLLSVAQSALACAACFGKSDDAMAKGMNMGIFTLLLFVFFVLSGVACFAVFLARRSAQFQASSTAVHPSAELAPSIDQPSK